MGVDAESAAEIVLEPGKLIGAEHAQLVDLLRVVEPDEVDALVSEAVPAGARRSFAEAFEIERAVVGGGVVLAGNVEDLAGFGALDDLLGGVELGRLGRVGDVAGVEQQVVFAGQRVDLVDGQLQCAGDVLICRLVEADVAVADLDEAELRCAFWPRLLSASRGKDLARWVRRRPWSIPGRLRPRPCS